MRILRISEEVPYPQNNGGRIETYHTTRQLAIRGHEVTLVAFQKDNCDTSPLNEYCESHAIPFHGSNSLLNVVRGVIEGTPITYVKWRDRQMLAKCLELLGARSYDAIVIEHSALGWYLFQLRKHVQIPILTRLVDLDTLIWERWVQSQSNPIKRMLGWQQHKFVKRYERNLALASDVCLTISARDTRLLREMAPGADVRFIPAGADIDYYAPSTEGQEPASILFLASHYQWHANLDAAKWLYYEIMPRIWQRVPSAKLYITGKHAPPEMQAWAEPGRVILTGYVPDERTLIAKASVLVIPMRLGGGMKLKMLTAFSSGKAVVSTSPGAEGFPSLIDGEQLLIRDATEAFADATADVIESRQLRERLEGNGRALVCEHFDWNMIGTQWEEALASATARGARSPLAAVLQS
jgi:polysaccharide biosynthesis protein PslH